MRLLVSALGASALLTGCTGQDGLSGTPITSARCSDQALSSFIGQKASAGAGAALLKASGSRSLRWSPPGIIMTTEFRPDRLTVSYDNAMTITSARCG